MNKPTNLPTRRLPARSSETLTIAVFLLMLFSAIPTCLAQILVPYNQTWNYNQTNVDLGTAWREANFDASGWPSGPGPLGFPVDEVLRDGLTIQTVLSRFMQPPNEAIQVRTYYFRTKFVFTNDPTGVTLIASNLIDDAVVVFLNGVEIGRPGFNEGTVVTHESAGDWGSGEVADYGYDVFTNTTALIQGTNVLAVEVHQTGAASSDLVFAHRLLAVLPTPAAITSQPTNITVAENRIVNLTVGVAGSPPPSFQWYRGTNPAVAITDATNQTYTVASTLVADTGDYFVIVRGALNVVTSSVARLIVVTDTDRPGLLGARGDDSFRKVILTWDERMSPDAAQEEDNYHLFATDGTEILNAVTLATMVNGTNVVLDLAAPLVLNGVYSLEVDYQIDLLGFATVKVGNPIYDLQSGIVTSVRAFVLSPGFARAQYYFNIGAGNAVADLTGHPKFPNNPDLTEYVSLFEQRTDFMEGYGTRISAWLLPPVSGAYNFFMSSDDGGATYLSTDADPVNKVLIATEPSWAGSRQYILAQDTQQSTRGTPPVNRSEALFPAGITLATGSAYYIEMLTKEGGGGDHGAVTWQLPGAPLPNNGDLPIPGAYMAALADPAGASVTITQQPVNKTFPGSTVAFSLDFNNNDGGFTVNTPQPFDGPWVYSGATGSWREDGQGPENFHANTSILNSPALVVRSSGNVLLSFVHRYSFEVGNWDGGQVRISVNGGPFTAVPGTAFTQNGYSGTVLAGASVLAGQEAFVNDSAGHGSGTLLTSVADLGVFSAGDTIRVQFIAASDTNTRGAVPNWEIDSVGSPSLEFFLGSPATTVTFSVGAARTNSQGSNPATGYQWFRDNGAGFVLIPGANGQTYTFAPGVADNGAQFRVTVYIPGASATSSAAILTIPLPQLFIRRQNTNVVISWPGPGTLQSSVVVTGSWANVSGVTNSSYTFHPAAAQRFYRVRVP